ncbi:WhiB family transcriptional regulator [Streptomyces sp. NPDC059011]|uniref:WhiB family transcriptional regulator n=1 Tax=unclassified Streptomyces TaxID=2593676 RepID=UPI0036CCE52A
MRHITTHEAPPTGLRSIADTNWQAHGACHWLYPEDADEIFFASPRDHAAIAEAKTLCAQCPVRRECFTYALENGLKEGIWGGLTSAERQPWHDKIAQRLDYRRIIALFNGRDVHLTATERDIVVDHAYARGWRADRLAITLRVSQDHARDLLTQAAHKLDDRDRSLGVPPPPKQRKSRKPTTSEPAQSQTADCQKATRPVKTISANAPLGKAA